jgi:FSR family fosmidomycin resistance protein-like MFS transporter
MATRRDVRSASTIFRAISAGGVAGARRGAAADPRLATGAGPDGGARNRAGGRPGVTGTGDSHHRNATGEAAAGRGRRGFGILTVIGALDTATRMGYLLFLPFLIRGRGGSSPTIGLALALLFIGGAFGKATCGWLGERLGVVRSVLVTEAATAVLIAATLFTPLTPTLTLLPLLGIVLNGTSSVLYGTVPELADGDTGRAFAVFYTCVIGSGGIAPILYGAIADHSSQTVGVLASAATAVLIVPLVLTLRRHLRLGRP